MTKYQQVYMERDVEAIRRLEPLDAAAVTAIKELTTDRERATRYVQQFIRGNTHTVLWEDFETTIQPKET